MIIDIDEYNKCREKATANLAVFDSYTKAESVLSKYDNVCVSVSGGKDSDLCVDIVSHLDKEKKARYIWFDTGLEYKATKDHLTYLEQKYDITIERIKAIKPISLSCKEYGVPFLSKYVSSMLERLQNHGFQFEDEDLDTLNGRYSKCLCALKWWTNARDANSCGYSQFNISYNKYLKEFMLVNPPDFPISSKCCTYAKKKVAHSIQADLMITGIRKAEGGIRSSAYKSCFDSDNG
ncbi:MAG: phosphoadenosine phosphosulfate reductase family protein [Firmicutes bacterium]|nr:phosphoadenosine phosphosulfate reductase family protein [Bacillota bacterium]